MDPITETKGIGHLGSMKPLTEGDSIPTRVSMEVSKRLVSGFITYLRDSQPTYINGCFWFLQKVVGGIKSPNWQYIPLIPLILIILPSAGLYATYHLVREPETTIVCIGVIFFY